MNIQNRLPEKRFVRSTTCRLAETLKPLNYALIRVRGQR
jgi:hypothetical protein